MDIQAIISNLLVTMPIFLLSLSVHEAAHALTADYLGDSTARELGRATLNPLPHIDFLGTIVMPILSALSGGAALIGWAKPVPIDWHNLRNIRRDDTLIALAGPASNLLLSLLFFGMLLVVYSGTIDVSTGTPGEFLRRCVQYGLIINIALAVFNMIPLPPLDGSHLVANLLPDELAERYRALGLYGIIILLFLLNFTPLRTVLGSIIVGIYNLYTDGAALIVRAIF
ncbi:MAG: site-2 protease family protein [Bacteroidota bacterium]|nr:site-2 protease family protein [Candidatus Kapabacteria bacterium]MDW8220097.1 site-2 protease family protein [Bacteroidota bacterium]